MLETNYKKIMEKYLNFVIDRIWPSSSIFFLDKICVYIINELRISHLLMMAVVTLIYYMITIYYYFSLFMDM